MMMIEDEKFFEDTKKYANEMVNKYLLATSIVFHIDDAKKCAIICVDEILDALLSTHDDYEMWVWWREVRKQIEKI